MKLNKINFQNSDAGDLLFAAAFFLAWAIIFFIGISWACLFVGVCFLLAAGYNLMIGK